MPKAPTYALLQKLKSLFLVSPYVLPSFLISLLWLVVSACVDGEKINLAASGAVMVGFSIFSEIMHQKWEFSWIIRRGRGAAFQDLQNFQPIGYQTNRVSEILKPLSIPSEYDEKTTGDWYVGTTAMRVDRLISIGIGAMAILGSLVWGYA